MKTLFPLMLLTACGEGPCDSWYCEDDEGLPASDTPDDSKDTKDGDKGSDKDGAAVTSLSGALDLSSTAGTFALEQEGCRSVFPLEALVPSDGCTDCDFAYSFTLGAPEASEMRCDKDETWTGALWEVGHEAPEQLWLYKGGWNAIDGTSMVTADTWTFGLSY